MRTRRSAASVVYVSHPEGTEAIHGLNLIPRRSAAARLEYALKPRESKDIKKNIIELIQTHLEPSLQVSEQTDSIEEMLDAFENRYPDIFGRETARSRATLKCAEEYAINLVFKKERHKWLQRNKGIAKSPSTNSNKLLNKRRRSRSTSVPSTDINRDLIGDSVIRVNSVRRPAMSASGTPHLPPPSPTYVSSSYMRDHYGIILSGQSHRLPSDFLYQFIDSCDPSMAKFYDTFKNFGCVSEIHLRAISRWPVDKIKEFLYMLPPGPTGKMSDMEIIFLTNLFQTYVFDCE